MASLYSFIRPALFALDPEAAHNISLNALRFLPAFLFKKMEWPTPISAMGLTFPHPIGLAAGLDKNGDYLDVLSKLGFSFIELGTVTPLAQEGQTRPRLFRLTQDEAIINRMGFNNRGVKALVNTIKKANYRGILGINIGKNKDTSLNKAAADYVYCLEEVYPYASYVTINISSPNTPDLRQLQQKDYLTQLLHTLQECQTRLTERYQRHVPLVVKVSPDEEDESLKQIAEISVKHGISGIIATNTSCARPSLLDAQQSEIGGLSGKPLFDRSTACLNLLRGIVGNQFTLIGVGGIHSATDASKKLSQGANLLQIYTALIYHGPFLIYSLLNDLHHIVN